MNDADAVAVAVAAPSVPLGTIFRTFLTAGAISFGGGVVAYLRDFTVTETKWLDDDAFLDALEISQTLPGLNAINMSVIIGDNLRGIPGAIAAVLGLVLPGVIVIMGLGAAWQEESHNVQVRMFLIGVAAAAVGLLSTVTLQLGHKQFAKPLDLAIILATFIAVSILRVPLYIVLLVIGTAAILLYRPGARHESLEERARHLRERLRHRHYIHLRH
ncbi:MAG TPA: chromate transporter [Candidatus Binataceae bacterium]|jgi:chromate transporter|nr:chromate transporter [Candidatus Binataceae bacterium]